jgi:tetratricopeptide (TPR) repeat protein
MKRFWMALTLVFTVLLMVGVNQITADDATQGPRGENAITQTAPAQNTPPEMDSARSLAAEKPAPPPATDIPPAAIAPPAPANAPSVPPVTAAPPTDAMPAEITEPVSGPAPPEPPNYNEKGLAFYEQEDFGAAILEFNRQLEYNPGDVSALVNRGLSFARRGEFKIAIENLYSALNMRNNDTVIMKYIASIYFLDREFNKSVDMYNRATTTVNLDPESFAGRGCAYMSLGKHGKAITDFSRVLYIASQDIRAYIGRGISHAAIGKHKSAISDFGRAIAISGDDPFIYLVRANSYARTGAHSKAVADLNRTCELNYTAVCIALKQARAEISGTEGSFVLQYSRKAPDEELYDISRKKLEQFYVAMRSNEMNKYFIEKLKPLKD